ncbi:unnamed protein product [Arabidopsis thaliana]|uniref:F-box associated beta-propeller type 3 domain-containing protein n=1 Tax=Arabidopsis thaliana TaxID=3702 RepID=A0A5S9WWN6_ARATH|nr:unnamed protein product [Arabidopsis thaliana]
MLRLPSKSVARFRCVSKQCASMFASPYFKKLFQTRSSAKPSLLFAIADYGIEEDYSMKFFSSPQLENTYEKTSSTLVAAAEFHVKFSPDKKAYSFFGFDPIGKQYKALSIAYPSGPGRHKILTLGDGDLTWRKIKCPVPRPGIKGDGICINGVLYFLAERNELESDYVIVCFDVRSEKFTYIDVERICRLINYKGKLAMIYWEDDVDIYEINHMAGKNLDKYLEENLDVDATNELHVWVLEDVEKQEWSKYAYTWTDDTFFRRHLSIAGATASGEIVFSIRKYTSKQPFYVFYFNPERNTLQRVETQGFGEAFKAETCSVRTFVNHVENLDVNDLKQLKSGHPPLVKPENYCLSDSDSESDGQGDEKR